LRGQRAEYHHHEGPCRTSYLVPASAAERDDESRDDRCEKTSSGVTPLAMAKAMASGSATPATVIPEKKSEDSVFIEYPSEKTSRLFGTRSLPCENRRQSPKSAAKTDFGLT